MKKYRYIILRLLYIHFLSMAQIKNSEYIKAAITRTQLGNLMKWNKSDVPEIIKRKMASFIRSVGSFLLCFPLQHQDCRSVLLYRNKRCVLETKLVWFYAHAYYYYFLAAPPTFFPPSFVLQTFRQKMFVNKISLPLPAAPPFTFLSSCLSRFK